MRGGKIFGQDLQDFLKDFFHVGFAPFAVMNSHKGHKEHKFLFWDG